VERAGGAVIANLAPRGLMRLLPRGSGEAGYDARMQRFRHAPGTMMLHLALDGLPDWAAGAELKRFMYVHLAPSLQQMSETYTQAVNGLLPREPVLVVGQPGTADPSRAPEGKHTLWVQVRMVPGTIRGDAAGAIDATDWEAAKAPMAERVLDILERYAPGLRGRILGRCVMSPAELEAENPNLVGGDQIAGSHHPYQNFLFRPVPGRADWSTPVPKLHHVGASTWPGGGTGAGSGTMLAEKLAGR
jgi:phytoene dehydrogenase-like protein